MHLDGEEFIPSPFSRRRTPLLAAVRPSAAADLLRPTQAIHSISAAAAPPTPNRSRG